MRHMNINRVMGITFIDDSNFIDIKYTDSRGNNIDSFVLKNTVHGLSKSKSFIVGKTKYHIHNVDSENLKLAKSLDKMNESMRKHIDELKGKFIWKGQIRNPKKEYIITASLKAADTPKTYGSKAILGPPLTGETQEIECVLTRSGVVSRNGVSITPEEMKKMLKNKSVKKRLKTSSHIDKSALNAYFEIMGMKIKEDK